MRYILSIMFLLAFVSVTCASPASDFIKQYEGFSATPYKDANGYSIGYGHFILPHEKFTTITKAEAEKLLVSDLAKRNKILDKLVRVELTENQRIALLSLLYNIGDNNFRKSTLLKKLNNKDYAGCAKEFRRWNKSQGKVLPALIKRRKAEALLFNT